MTRSFAVKTVHKGMYPATHNFKDEADGAFPSDSNWTDGDGAGCATTVIASKDGHRKVLQFHDNGVGTRAEATVSITQGLNTEIEFFLTKDSIAADTTFYVWLYEGATRIIYLFFEADDLRYNDGAWQDLKLNFLVANTLSHFRIVLDDTANTFSCYIDGVLIGAAYGYENNSTSGIDSIIWRSDNTDTGYYTYLDALGVSTDTDYNIGDNIHYRHFKESTDSFEGDDVGTQGTSITWVDAVDTAPSFEIVQEFNEHKKILRGYYSSGAGGYDYCSHTFASQAKTGWWAGWVKTSDATAINTINLREGTTQIISFRFSGDKFQVFTGGAMRDVTNGPIPVDDTWYFIYIQWYDAATDTFDLWIDNIQYEVGTNCRANQTAGIDNVYLEPTSATEYLYLDAPMSSLDSDERADNRTFDYHDPYTKTDITSDVKNIPNYQNAIYGHRKATLHAKSSYEFDNVFFEIYDINSKLVMRGEIKNRMQIDKLYQYPLRDMNWDDLNEPITNVFATDAIHDPADPTSMLKVSLPNVDQTEGDLILADADTEAATYSPTLRNYPTHMFLRDISDLGDTVTIVKANGIVLLDDDLASGDSLDVDVGADKNSMTMAPIIVDILETINYFEIFGAINPVTGQRFYKITDNSGTDKKRKWRYTNNELLNQTDVDAYAAALILRTIPVRLITVQVQGLGAHNMGTTLNYKYIKGDISIAQANYYIISEYINFDRNLATIILSEGLIEESKYSYSFERPENYVNSFASEIYETDIIVNVPPMTYVSADEYIGSIRLDAVGEKILVKFYLEGEIDSNRPLTMSFVFYRVDANNDTIVIIKNGNHFTPDGADAGTLFWDAEADTLPACVAGKHQIKVFTITASDLVAGDEYVFSLTMNEAAREVYIYSCTLRYYMKRTV